MTGSVNGKRGVLSFLFKESFCAARSAATVLLSGAFRTVIVYSASTTSTAQSCGMREMTTLIQNDRLKMITIWLIAEKGYFKAFIFTPISFWQRFCFIPKYTPIQYFLFSPI